MKAGANFILTKGVQLCKFISLYSEHMCPNCPGNGKTIKTYSKTLKTQTPTGT